MQSDKIGILIADDQALYRAGLRRALESVPGFRVLGEAADGEQTLELARQLLPKILLLDIRMPKLSGLEVLRELKSAAIPIRTLILTAALESEEIVQALQLDACGIILKHAPTDVLFKGIRSVLAGRFWVGHASVSNRGQALFEFQPRSAAARSRGKFGLSERELEIVSLITSGYDNREIGKELRLSEGALKHHLSNLFDKLGVCNRLELILFSLAHHLADNFQRNLV